RRLTLRGRAEPTRVIRIARLHAPVDDFGTAETVRPDPRPVRALRPAGFEAAEPMLRRDISNPEPPPTHRRVRSVGAKGRRHATLAFVPLRCRTVASPAPHSPLQIFVANTNLGIERVCTRRHLGDEIRIRASHQIVLEANELMVQLVLIQLRRQPPQMSADVLTLRLV